MRDATPSVSKPPTSQTEIDKASTAAFSRSNPSRRSPLTVTTSTHIKKSLLVDMEMKEFETDSSFRTEDLMLENSFLDQECTKTEEQCVQLQVIEHRIVHKCTLITLIIVAQMAHYHGEVRGRARHLLPGHHRHARALAAN